MTAQCCVCKKLESRGKWKARKRGLLEKITYSYCPRCFAEARRYLQAEREKAEAIQAAV